MTAASELFEARGYTATTMDDVARAAGISRKSLFLYFPSKSDLIWHREGPYLQNLASDLAKGEGETLAVITAAIMAGFREARIPDRTLRTLSTLHADDPEVRELVEKRGVPWRALIAERLCRDGWSPLIADLIAYGYWRSLRNVLETGDLDRAKLLRAVEDALRSFEVLAEALAAVEGSTAGR